MEMSTQNSSAHVHSTTAKKWNNPNAHQLTYESTKRWCMHKTNTFQQLKGIKYWSMPPHWSTSKILCQVREASHKRAHTVQVHWHKTSQTGKSTDRKWTSGSPAGWGIQKNSPSEGVYIWRGRVTLLIWNKEHQHMTARRMKARHTQWVYPGGDRTGGYSSVSFTERPRLELGFSKERLISKYKINNPQCYHLKI